MPGIVVFGRRWSVGSDDMIVPALLLVCLHVIWLATLATIFLLVKFDLGEPCTVELKTLVVGYIIILLGCIVLESVMTIVSLRGSILETGPRSCMQYLLYMRLVVFLGEMTWLIVGIRWIIHHDFICQPDPARQALLGITVFNACMILLGFISIWCTFDTAGRKWVKFKRYQESMKEKTQRSRRSGSARRNWRQRTRLHLYLYQSMQRKAMRAYEESWDRRLGLMCCCVDRKGRNKNSMSEIAQLFTEFFRDLDVVPSDVVAGLVLLRRFQKLRMQHTINQDVNDVYRYLSGVAVTPRTQFLQLGQPEVLEQYKQVIHYMKFAMAAYGWPVFMMMNTGTGLCRMMPYLSSCCHKGDTDYVLNDNCCQCNVVALKKISGIPDLDLVYVNYHVDIGETPFFVAVDNQYKKIVICVRGTLSLQDVLTDLKADAETLPLDPVREDWVGHKGMVQAAIYIKKKLKEDMILVKAFQKVKERDGEKYELVLVGHSLGAGTAAILAIMLQQEYQEVQCYAYSPPGGLLSSECVEATKSFITSVVIAKDVVPRIGLHQMELLRTDLINIIKTSSNPKWKIIAKALCCGSNSASHAPYGDVKEDVQRNVTKHPSDEQIGLTAHKPMFPPGKIILVVRNHNGRNRRCCGEAEPVYQAIWADNSDFQEVLVSPTMVNDHMPDNVLDALEKVLVNVAPPKPTRKLSETERKAQLLHESTASTPITPLIHNNLTSDPSDIEVLQGNHNNGHDTTPYVGFSKTLNKPEAHIYLKENAPNARKDVNVLVNAKNNGWDDATEELLLGLDKDNLFPGLGHDPHLMIDLDNDWEAAPLATPEVLSIASSMSGLSRTCSVSKGEYKSESMSGRLDPIKQSPETQSRAASSSQDSVADVQETISEMGSLKTEGMAECKSIGDLLQRANPLHEQVLDASKGSMANLLPNESKMDLDDTFIRQESLQKKTVSIDPSIDGAVATSIESDKVELTKSRSQSPIVKFQMNEEDNETELSESKEDLTVYERHSPVETTQYGYADPNDVYSAASIGYTCIPNGSCMHEHSENEMEEEADIETDTNTNSSVELDVKHSPQITRSPDKRLQYSQSESRLKGLSDQFTMKRSTEEGDIAHLTDSTKVFVAGDKIKKKLKQRGSEPAFDKNMLPKVETNRLEAVCESDGSVVDQESVPTSPEHKDTADIESVNQLLRDKLEISIEELERDSFEIENETTSDKTCLLRNKSSTSSDEDQTFRKSVSSRNSQGSLRSSPGRTPDEATGDMRLFHSQSCHSTFTSSPSAGSEQRLSLVSGTSEDLPVTETDV